MNNLADIISANSILIQHFARSYLSEIVEENPTILEGAYIQTRRIGNRSNVPTAAVTTSHLIQHPELGFSLKCRAVWFAGRLLPPTTTHVAIECISHTGSRGTDAEAIAAGNEWLRAVTP